MLKYRSFDDEKKRWQFQPAYLQTGLIRDIILFFSNGSKNSFKNDYVETGQMA
ncbi:hypothetical protein HanXRQr2_Chr13g0569521 [Helianthus annuus]|uniref:Uncharacterized protein n=1 Tax=Helianthus annuus TaxID=4232 RepID=A0A9K3HAY5_HELAN|nr:hypothetical protein HanXRQr2_Chr13g0569521 [Helianthus annuus]